jgi:hypothetical protein
MTDEEIEGASTKRTMIMDIGYEHWAMSQEDAINLLGIFTRARKVEQVHTSSYRRSVWIPTEDQNAPVSGASVGDVTVPQPVGQADAFSAATRAVS